MKKCPFCAEEIQNAATKCKHCGEFLTGRWLAPHVPNVAPPNENDSPEQKQNTDLGGNTIPPDTPNNATFWYRFQKGPDAYERGDYATALKEMTPLAEQGNVDAQTYLGVMYDKGQGVPQDDQTAVKWYTLAADQGYAPAQSNLGWMYGKGQGVPQDYQTAVRWFTLAAEQGYAPAQSNLGWMYYLGQGVPQDYLRAHMWANLSASQGNEDAAKRRKIVEKQMTPADISAAQKLARECVAKNYKGC